MTTYFKPTLGRPPLFDTPEQMYAACCKYFEWVAANPLFENKVFQFQGAPVPAEIEKPRAMTLVAMCTFLGFSRDAWENYRKREAFAETCELVDNIIYTQKFELAAADLLNVNLIARDLGLRDKQDINHSSPDGSMTPQTITFNIVKPDAV